ncbi:hypothetical protein QR680_012141 [Steinernema hermaphroditum]|uniref:Uncharacterized protein n=1 Tax=Steinernema hermaphroditum TaxID=289476 RepID=A0AA39I115_9BILA|nr:hypothetical protein QR680_012141 [Steinernema hermaphroditum]
METANECPAVARHLFLERRQQFCNESLIYYQQRMSPQDYLRYWDGLVNEFLLWTANRSNLSSIDHNPHLCIF